MVELWVFNANILESLFASSLVLVKIVFGLLVLLSLTLLSVSWCYGVCMYTLLASWDHWVCSLFAHQEASKADFGTRRPTITQVT